MIKNPELFMSYMTEHPGEGYYSDEPVRLLSLDQLGDYGFEDDWAITDMLDNWCWITEAGEDELFVSDDGVLWVSDPKLISVAFARGIVDTIGDYCGWLDEDYND